MESRRIKPEDAEKAIKEYGAKFPEGAERDKKLTELFAAFLNAAFGICLGCQIYPLVARFRKNSPVPSPA